jgi:hypothetical protein
MEEQATTEQHEEPQPEQFGVDLPIWHYLGYGLLSGLITVLVWSLVPMMPNHGALLSIIFVLVVGVVAVVWIRLLQWLAEKICGIPFQLRHILLALVSGYVASFPLLMLVPLPANLMLLVGFTLGSGFSIRYFAS